MKAHSQRRFDCLSCNGPLKEGNKLSIRGGVDLVPGDEVVTVKSITKIEGPTRVYNLEVASLDGQITHNYFIGEDEIWAHNAQRQIGGSGKPRIHVKRFPSRKKAKNYQANKPGSSGAICHTSPRKGRRHFHPVDRSGDIIKDGTHAEY